MKSILRYCLLFLLLPAQYTIVRAQVDSTHRIGDTLDASNNYRYEKSFPKYINPGLEFYEGAQLALDFLQKENARLEVHIYDTRSSSKNIAQILQSPEFQKTELIIGHVGPGELQQLATAAAQMNVPFIRYVTLDDVFGVTALTPYLGSTTQTICIAGSLDENFARMLCQGLASVNKTYSSLVIGMPTWDNTDFSHAEFNGEEIIFSTPFYINPAYILVQSIQQYFKVRFFPGPAIWFSGDMRPPTAFPGGCCIQASAPAEAWERRSYRSSPTSTSNPYFSTGRI